MPSQLQSIKKTVKRKLFYLANRGDDCVCSLCSTHLKRFMPGGIDLPVLREKEVVGGGYRNNMYCPSCGCTDRERLLVAYLSDNLSMANLEALHVAPERNLHAYLKANCRKVVPADLQPQNYKHIGEVVQLSLTEIPYADDSFNLVVANHVMEHIPDDKLAMSEVRRVLANNGLAVLQVPYSYIIEHTEEDLTIDSDTERERSYGQFDHVRLYAYKDYVNRLKSVGFSVEVIEPAKLAQYAKFGVNPDEAIFLCKKQLSS